MTSPPARKTQLSMQDSDLASDFSASASNSSSVADSDSDSDSGLRTQRAIQLHSTMTIHRSNFVAACSKPRANRLRAVFDAMLTESRNDTCLVSC